MKEAFAPHSHKGDLVLHQHNLFLEELQFESRLAAVDHCNLEEAQSDLTEDTVQ
jgi:hypothetical protein